MTHAKRRKAKSCKSHAHSSNKIYVLTPLAAAVVGALSPISGTVAQESDLRIDEIIVSATKREMSLQDVPQSIQAISNSEIQKQALNSMEDIAKAVPSLTIAAIQPGRNTLIFRGMTTGTDEWRTDSQSAVYLDEQPMTAVSQQIDPRLVDINRVESLPGPQGTLFGSSSQSGTLRIITNKPDPSAFSGQFDLRYGNTDGGADSYDISGHLNIPMSDKFAARIVAYSVEEGGWIDNVLGTALTGLEDNAAYVDNDFNKWTTTGGRLSLKWDVSDKWSALVTVMAQNSETEGSWASDPGLGEDQVVKFYDNNRTDDWVSYALTIKGDLGFAEFTSATAYVDRDIVYMWDNHVYDSYKSTAAHDCSYPGYPSTCYLMGLYDLDYIIGTTFNDQIQQRFSQELRLTSTSESRFQWMIGAFYEDVDDEWFFGTLTPGLGGTPAMAYANYWAYYYNYWYGYDIQYPLPDNDIWWRQDYERNVKQLAVFGEMSYDLSESFTLTVGARWFENERFRFEHNSFPEGFPSWGQFDTNGDDIVEGKVSDSTYKLGGDWRVNDSHMLYFVFSQGFRVGGENSVRSSSAGFVDQEYEPDTADNFEIGNKSTFMDGRLQLNASLFRMEWDNIQLPRWNPDIWWQNGVLNGGTAVTEGIEVTFDFAATENFSIRGAFSFVDAEYTEDIFEYDPVDGYPNPPDRDEVIDTPKGTSMPFSPDERYWVALDYNIPTAVFGGDLWLRYDIYGQSDSYKDRGAAEAKTVSFPSWNVSNMAIGWSGGSGWDVTIRAKNVWNDRYIQALSDSDNDNMDFYWPADPRYRDMTTYNRPREISVGITKRFD